MGEVGPTSLLGKWVQPQPGQQKVVFEGAYSPFGSIAAMDIRGNKLECAPIRNDCIFVGCAGFIVQDVDYGRTVGCGKPGMDVLVGSNCPKPFCS